MSFNFDKKQEQLIRAICNDTVLWAEHFLLWPGKEEYFKANYAQRRILNAPTRKVVACIHRRAGKCVAFDEVIALADGRRVKAESLINKKFKLLTFVGGKQKAVDAYASYNSYEEVYEITTDSGRKFIRNFEHPFWKGTLTSVLKDKPKIESIGWTPAGSLKEGDLVAAPVELQYELQEQFDIKDEEIKLIAYLIGDGSVSSKSKVSFTQDSNIQLEEFKNCCSTLGIKFRNYPSSKIDYGLSNALSLTRRFNIQGCNSFTKKVPEQFFQLSLRQLQIFLSRLYSTDGWASVTRDKNGYRGAGEIGYCSVSEQLIRDIQHLLLRFGINSLIHYKPKTNSYSLVISDKINIIKFKEKIGIYGKEKALNNIYEIAKTLEKVKEGRAEQIVEEKGAIFKIYTDTGTSRKVAPFTRKIDITPWRIKKAPQGCRWERITSVKKLESKQHTVAITVPEYNTFLTDFYEHNTSSALVKVLHKVFTTKESTVLIIAPGEAQLVAFFDELDSILNTNPILNADVNIRRSKPQVRGFKNGSKIKGFIAKNGSQSLRGQAGDLIIVDEADFIDSSEWKVIDPIVRGDKYRKPPQLLAISTPNVDPKSRFMTMLSVSERDTIENDFSEEERFLYFNEVTSVFLPVDKNPEYSAEEVEEIKKEYYPDRIAQFETEWLCLPVSTSERLVFPKRQVESASCMKPFIKPDTKDHFNGYAPHISLIPRKVEGEIRTVGVDWDRIQAGPSIIMVSYRPGLDGYKVIYREEVDKTTPFLFNYTCQHILDLYKYTNFDYVYLEATRDVAQLETLQLMAKKELPELFPKIKSVDYNENYISVDYKTGETIKRRMKGVVVGNLQNMFENYSIQFPEADKDLNRQLSNYEIISYTERGARYSNKNEHFVDALGLAMWAMFKHYNNPLKGAPARQVVGIKRPDPEDFINKTSRGSGAYTQKHFYKRYGTNRSSGFVRQNI